MKRLPLYPEGLNPAAVNLEAPAEPTSSCDRCELYEEVKNPCMALDGRAGGLYVIGEKPSRLEDTANKVFYGQHALQFRRMLEKHWSKPAAFDYAIRCATGAKKLKDKHIDKCRAYTANAIDMVNPDRIICLGNEAAYSILGRRVNSFQIRRAYSWCTNLLGDYVPVFILPNPAIAFRNPFSTRAFEEDLKWALRAKVEPWFVNTYTNLVYNKKDAKAACAELGIADWITYDVETYGLMHNKEFRIEAITLLANNGSEAFTWTREALKDAGARAALRALLDDAHIAYTTQNGKYDDRSAMLDLGAAVPTIRYDTRLGRKLLEPEASAKLDVLAETVGMGGHKQEAGTKTAAIKKELNRQAFPLSEFTPSGKRRKIAPPKFNVESRILDQIRLGAKPEAFMYGFLDDDTLYRYNARDVFSTRAVALQDEPVLMQHPTISRAWNLVVKDANKAVRHIERWGFPVDRQAVLNLVNHCDLRLKELGEQMRKHTDVNPGSPKQLGKYLYDKLGLKCDFLTDSGAQSTDANALEALKGQHPYVDLLLEWRKLSKFSGTYGHGMLRHIRDDGRIHTSFLLDGAGTGRLSSQEPNLQNIPRAKGSELGTMARNCFVASSAAYTLLEFDFSQLELRIAAMLSGDQAMIEDYRNGIDIHSNGARECCEIVWKIPRAQWDKMSKDERDPYRSQIKTTIFGKLYGKTSAGLAREFGVPVRTVEMINRTIWGRYKKLEAFMNNCITESRKTGEAWTWWDGGRARVRPIWRILDQDQATRSHYERTAGNTAVQGTAAEFMTASLWPIVKWILDTGARAELVSTVHDAVILNVHKSEKLEVAKKVKAVMEGHNSLGVPLAAEAKEGPSWGNMKDLHLEAA